MMPSKLKPLWKCPKCGARLVSKNLWHSCGRFTLGALFAASEPSVLALAKRYIAMVQLLGDVQVIPQKTRLVCVARVRFAGLTPRKDYFLAAFALQRRLKSARVVRHIDYGPRWQGHYVRIKTAADLDQELRAWLKEAYDVAGMQSDLGVPLRMIGPSAACSSSGGEVDPHDLALGGSNTPLASSVHS
jgi:hypothetical protein